MRTTLLTFFFLFLLIRLNAQNANFQWVRQIGGTINDEGNCITLDAAGSIYTTGFFSGTVDFNPGAGSFNLTAKGSSDVFISKLDSSGNFVWAKQLGGVDDERGNAIAVDKIGNIYTTGYFNGKADFNPGTDSFFLTAVYNDIFISKLDQSGKFIWAKQLGGTGTNADVATSIVIDDKFNVFTTGYFQNTADFDPGPATFNLTTSGFNYDVFVSKLDSAGKFKFAKQLGGSNMERAFSIRLDGTGNIFTAGNFQGACDFNPGAADFILTPKGSNEIFISKLDTSGKFIWAKQFTGISSLLGNGMSVDPSGNVYTTGLFKGTFDFDPDAGTFNLTSGTTYDIFISKIDSAGKFAWAKQLVGGSNNNYGYGITVDRSGSVYITGHFSNTVDFDPAAAISNLSAVGLKDIFILKLGSSGDFVWAKQLGGPGGTNGNKAYSITVDNDYNVFTTGFFDGTVDFNPGAGTFNKTTNGSSDIFIHKMTQSLCPDLAIVYDKVSNVNCNTKLGFIATHTINGTRPYKYVWNTIPVSNDSIIKPPSGGVYEVSVTDAKGCFTTSLALINEPGPVGFDLNVNLVRNRFRPTLPVILKLDAFNTGCVLVDGVLKFVLSDLVTYNGATPTPASISGDTLIWNMGKINFDSPNFTPQVFVTTNQTAPMGDTMCFIAIVNPIKNDVNPLNNIKEYCFVVGAGFDPNNIEVYPKGNCVQGYVLPSQVLTYTINFQNTGNDTAYNVFIIDSLSSYLDIKSLRIVGNSHPLITQILSDNKVKFRFDQIYLVDSNRNEPGSHGYIIFELKPVASLPSFTKIENKAKIYFDHNIPVLTNTVTNTVVNTIPSCIVGLKKEMIKNEFLIFPNPVHSELIIKSSDLIDKIVIEDVLGNEIISETQIKSTQIDGLEGLKIKTTDLSNGIYFIRLLKITEGKQYTFSSKRFLVQH